MNQDIAVIKIMDSIEKQSNHEIGYSHLQIIRTHLYMMFGVGYEEGNRQSKKWKPILQMKKGVIVQEYPSVVDAHNDTKIDKGNIGAAARGLIKTAGGYDWRYKGEITKWRYRRY